MTASEPAGFEPAPLTLFPDIAHIATLASPGLVSFRTIEGGLVWRRPLADTRTAELLAEYGDGFHAGLVRLEEARHRAPARCDNDGGMLGAWLDDDGALVVRLRKGENEKLLVFAGLADRHLFCRLLDAALGQRRPGESPRLDCATRHGHRQKLLFHAGTGVCRVAILVDYGYMEVPLSELLAVRNWLVAVTCGAPRA